MPIDIRPNETRRRVTDIDVKELMRRGIKALVLDLDNTLARWNDMEISDAVRAWIDECKRAGMLLCICSNNHAPRVRPVAESLGIEYICDAGKPGKKAFLRAADKLGLPSESVASVGDQFMTDVIGARRAGMYAVLTNPIGGREYWGTYINRILERLFMRILGVKRPANTEGEHT